MPNENASLRTALRASAAVAGAVADALKQAERSQPITWTLKPTPDKMSGEGDERYFDGMCFTVPANYPQPPINTLAKVAEIQRILAGYLDLLAKRV